MEHPSPPQDTGEICFHCGLPVSDATRETAPVAGQERAFCCAGCKAVCQAIHAAGLEGFYRRTPSGQPLGPPPEPPANLALYDLDAVQEEFADTGRAVRDIHLLVEGIHCAACVWLIEKGLQSLPGVEEARVNLTGRRLRVRWDNGRLRLSRILGRLAELGYAAAPFDPTAADDVRSREQRAMLYRLAWAGFAMMNLMWISIALYSGADRGEFRELFQWLGCLIATPTLIYSGAPFFRGAWAGLRNRALGMDLPIAIGVTVTYAYSLAVTLGLTTRGDVYWDTVVNFLFVILVGRYLESIARGRAVSATRRLMDLQPRVATRLDEDGGESVVAIRALAVGDRVLIRPGERIPVDGEVIEGQSTADESLLTGESRPVARGIGDPVVAGAINGAGVLRARVTGILRDTALGRILELVETAQASQAPIQRLADRIVPWFVAGTLGLAALTFFAWLRTDLELAVMAATAVLIVTCPCALGMATPMAVAVATGRGAARGILVRNGAALERLSSIDRLVFDKTGTLTEGRPAAVALATPGAMPVSLAPGGAVDPGSGPYPAGAELAKAADRAGAGDPAVGIALADILTAVQRASLGRIGALERLSEHPLATAILNLCERAGIATRGQRVEAVEVAPGLGIRGRVDGVEVAVGNAAWLRRRGIQVEYGDRAAGAGASPDADPEGLVHCAEDGRETLRLWIEDPPRPDAAAAVARLRARGLQLAMLTGDRRATAERIAARLGGGIETFAELLPEDKERAIVELQGQGGRVAMVGDGINDAPALVRADVGIAMGSGTDVSIASADIVLMSSEPERVLEAIELARRTLRVIRQNLGISLVYNLAMVPLAMAGVVTPLIAAIAMPLSSLAVIGNSARIRAAPRASMRSPAAVVPGVSSRHG